MESNMPGPELKEMAFNRVVILKNKTCVYCGREITLEGAPDIADEEHIIGRRFIPRGKLHGQWNLIVQACKVCNRKKSDLEDDISAITMQANAWGTHTDEDQVLAKEAKRKGVNSISRRTGKPVKESAEELKLNVPFAPGVEFKLTFTSPPQIERERIYELARLQLIGFFYFLTYNEETKKGGYWLGDFFPIPEAPRSDWGNPVHKAFMDAIVEWEPRLFVNTADGFFKAIIRGHPEAECWSWGLEWNKNYRVVGFFGEQETVQTIVNTFPPMEAQTISQGPSHYTRSRSETKLDEEDDKLFLWNDEA